MRRERDVVRGLALVVSALFAVLGGGGCVPSLEGNEARAPRVTVPSTYERGDHVEAPKEAPPPEASAVFGDLFASAELRGLVREALANDRELAVQLQEIVIARAEVSARQGEVLPKVRAGASVGVEKVGRDTSQGRADESDGVPENLGDFGFGLSSTWEVDVWKRLRNAAKASAYRAVATAEARRFVATEIVSELVRSYYELLALDRQAEILRRNVAIQARALEIVRLEKEAARVTELAVQRFQAEVLKNQSRLFAIEQERTQTENRVCFLIGSFPRPIARRREDLDAALPDAVRAGLPANLLRGRPDVRRAELELEATKLDVDVARAAFYPSLTIDAGLGYRSFNAAHLLATPGSLAYGLAAGVSAPLLNRAAITAEYRAANARQIQAVLRYEETLLRAFGDVATQLANVENLGKSAELKARQVDALARSVEVSNVLFQSARADYVEVLLTQRDSLDAEMELVENKRQRFVALAALYQALGGSKAP